MNVLYFMKHRLPEDLEELIKEGLHSKAREELENMIESSSGSYRRRLEFELDRLNRWPVQYPYTLKEAYEIARKSIKGLTWEEFQSLSYCLDRIKLEGEVRVFRRFLPNMVWLCPSLKARYLEEDSREEERRALRERALKVMKGDAEPLIFRVRAELEVENVPEGEKVRIWLPVPRVSSLHPEVKVLSYSEEPYISSEDYPQRTAFFETTTHKAWVEYEVLTVPHFDVEEVEREHLEERIPHIRFSVVKEVVKSLTEGVDDPMVKARRIWDWVVENTTYTYVHDYALFDNISEFAFMRRRGDCGVQAILLITMLRSAGIPARWQSGWYANPVRWGMHDWAQMYVEPMGWVYLDPSFGHPRGGELWRKDFYFGRVEGFRLAFNSEVNYPFDPPKTHFRSDPVDNQAGEAEWEGGNVYMPKTRLEILEVRREFSAFGSR